MGFRLSRFFSSWVFVLVLLAALSACIPSNQLSPAVASSPSSLPLELVPGETLTPTFLTATPTLPPPAPSLMPSAAAPRCLSIPGQLTGGVAASTLLAKPMTYRVYLPPCYTEEPQRRYPVLFLLHGQTYNEDQWIRLGARAVMDRLVAAGEISPFIIVFPYDYSHLQPGQYPFEQVFIETLLPQIDAAYRTLPGPTGRAVGGLSRGGAWALHLGLYHPELFSAIGAHSPAIFYTDGVTLPLRMREIPEAQFPRLSIDVGDADKELQQLLDFKNTLDAQNLPYEWRQFIGFHDEPYWRAHVELYLRWYGDVLGE